MKYREWVLTSVKVDSHTSWWTGALATWEAHYGANRNKPIIFQSLPSPGDYGMTINGKRYESAFCEGLRPRQLIDVEPIEPVRIDLYSKSSASNGKDWHDRHKTGKIVVGSLSVSSGTIEVKPTEVPTLITGQKVVIAKTMGLDGKWYYDARNAVNASYAYAYMYFTFEMQNVELVTPTLPYYQWLGKNPFSWVDTSIDSGVVTSALASANGGEYDLLTELAELPETVRYLISIVKGVPELIKNFKRRSEITRKAMLKKGKTAVEIADAIASLWLQYRYAIMPILYSIEDVRGLLKHYKRVYAKFRSKTVFNEFLPDGHMGYSFSGTCTVTHRCFVKRAYSPEALIDALLDILKLNPIATAWELVPLSFVVDWFLNIGDCIDALTGYNASIAEASTYSVKAEIDGTLKHPDGRVINISTRAYRRSVIDPLAHVGLSLEFDLSWKQKLDALALIWGPVSKNLKDVLK